MNEYVISIRQVSSRRIECCWTPNPFPGQPNSFWVEYPFEVSEMSGVSSLYPALAAMLPLCFSDCRFRLESSLMGPDQDSRAAADFSRVASGWQWLLQDIAAVHFGRGIQVKIELPPIVLGAAVATAQPRTGLFFGGGAESLLVLGELLAKGIKPMLISFVGPGWIGSDPAHNPTKLQQDFEVAQGLGLEVRHIATNAYGAFSELQHALEQRLVSGVYFANAISFTPAMMALFAPLATVDGIGAVCHGNEKQQFDGDLTYYCFTPEFGEQLKKTFAPLARYEHLLSDLDKMSVVEKLWTAHPAIGRYQYSCFANRHRRWCLNCEKCFRYYVMYQLYDIPLQAVDFNEEEILKNLEHARSPIIRELLDDDYRRHYYPVMLRMAGRSHKAELERLLMRCLRRARREQQREQARSLVRPLVPEAMRRLVKRILSGSSLIPRSESA